MNQVQRKKHEFEYRGMSRLEAFLRISVASKLHYADEN